VTSSLLLLLAMITIRIPHRICYNAMVKKIEVTNEFACLMNDNEKIVH